MSWGARIFADATGFGADLDVQKDHLWSFFLFVVLPVFLLCSWGVLRFSCVFFCVPCSSDVLSLSSGVFRFFFWFLFCFLGFFWGFFVFFGFSDVPVFFRCCRCGVKFAGSEKRGCTRCSIGMLNPKSRSCSFTHTLLLGKFWEDGLWVLWAQTVGAGFMEMLRLGVFQFGFRVGGFAPYTYVSFTNVKNRHAREGGFILDQEIEKSNADLVSKIDQILDQSNISWALSLNPHWIPRFLDQKRTHPEEWRFWH